MPKVSDAYKQERRKEILAAAKEVFRRKGYEPTTMKDIKEEAEISFGALYSYFSSTEEIFTHLLMNEQNHHNAEQELEENPDDEGAWGEIVRFIDGQENELKAIKNSLVPISYEFFVASWREEHRMPILKEKYQQANVQVTSLINKGIEEREFHPSIKAEEISRLLISTLEGLNIGVLFLGYEESYAKNQLDSLKKVLQQILGWK